MLGTQRLTLYTFLSAPLHARLVLHIQKLRAATEKYSALTLQAGEKSSELTLQTVLTAETNDKKLIKLIRSESGVGSDTGTVALLWMKRTMQFVLGLLQALVADANVSLSSASRKSYAATLRYCHNFVTRGVFDTGLRFAPSRESFYKNLAGGDAEVGRVETAMEEFLSVFEPIVGGIVRMYKEMGLELYIK